MKHLVLALSVLLGGCNVKAAIDKQAAKSDEDKAQAAPAAPVARPKPAEPVRNKGIIGKMTDEVVDYEKAIAENPNLIEVELKASGNDYISFMASAYINVRSRASMFGMEAALKQFKIVEERNPTYAEMMKMIKENHVEFTMLPRYRVYAYDAKRGVFAVLEDPALHKTE
ncbi:MAG: hypothetical protein WD648_10645 [Planctomycetaceae bacterium]